jgi:hypothetical protein
MKFIIMQFSPQSVFLPFRSKYLPPQEIFFSLPYPMKSRDSSVSIVTRLRAGRWKFDSPQGLGIFLFATASRGPPSLLSNGYRVFFPRK